MALPCSDGWGIAQVGHDMHALQVICVDLATYAEQIACVTWSLKHYDELFWKSA